MDRRLIKAAAIIIVILLIAAVYVIKNSGSIAPMQSSIDEKAGVLQSGRENLRFTGRLNGVPEGLLEDRINELLHKVGMAEAADKKTAAYSRGMKQRLGIADVLMKDPEVIIMDEPTLGIDPEGMRGDHGLF